MAVRLSACVVATGFHYLTPLLPSSRRHQIWVKRILRNEVKTLFHIRQDFNTCCTSIGSLKICCSQNKSTGRRECEEKGSCSDDNLNSMSTMVGGVREVQGFQNNLEIDELGRFAVDEHNKKENKVLEYSRVVKAKEQVVAGTLHHLTLEVVEAGKNIIYEAKIWVKPWMNFKELQEFKQVGDSVSCTSSDLGAKQDGHGPGWRAVPAHDPVVQDAANHAVKTIQQRSNSLAPYELLEVLLAKAEVIDEVAKLNLLLKVKRGSKEEKYNVEVHKTEGSFRLNHMEQDSS